MSMNPTEPSCMPPLCTTVISCMPVNAATVCNCYFKLLLGYTNLSRLTQLYGVSFQSVGRGCTQVPISPPSAGPLILWRRQPVQGLAHMWLLQYNWAGGHPSSHYDRPRCSLTPLINAPYKPLRQ